ncbi:MAG: 30S ribosomal protein S20 [Phycisphaerales bacterium]|nr:30S ribosomal protein S20 [Phycisphaerales bacterium]
MAHSLSAKKRIRQNVKNQARNRWRKITMRTAIKSCLQAISHGTDDEARTSFRTACSIIDKTASKRVIHRNMAARTKSRLSARLKAKTQVTA